MKALVLSAAVLVPPKAYQHRSIVRWNSPPEFFMTMVGASPMIEPIKGRLLLVITSFTKPDHHLCFFHNNIILAYYKRIATFLLRFSVLQPLIVQLSVLLYI